MLEKTIEQYLVKRVKEVGGHAYKFSSPNFRSAPDRIVLAPGGVLFFVECKAPGKKPTVLQAITHKLFRKLGQIVYVVDSKEQIDSIMEVLNE